MYNFKLIALVLTLLFLNAFTQSSDGVEIGYFTDNTDISYQSSLYSLVFRWELVGSTNPQYAVGNINFSEKYTAFTTIPNSQSPDLSGIERVVVEFNSINFENEENIIITIRDDNNISNIYTSSSIKVGSYDGLYCENEGGYIWNPQSILGSKITLPPQTKC